MDEELISSFQFPPGFRFHPSDEELIVHYLLNKVNLRTLPASVIAEIELYNFNPWDLPKKALFGQDEWFFFSPRDRKYPNGTRPNRAAASGFWKATGTDKPILTSSGSRRIGVKKALVFYTGHPPKGVKTDWIMNEYRLPETTSRSLKSKGSMRLDDWVLCRVRQKGNMSKKGLEIEDNPTNVATGYLPKLEELPSPYTKSNNMDIITDRRFKEIQLMASILIGRDLPASIESISSTESFQGRKSSSNNNGLVYEAGSGITSNICSPGSLFDQSSINPSKDNNTHEENRFKNLHESADELIEDQKNEEFLQGNLFYGSSKQSEADIYDPIEMNLAMSLAELNESLFSRRFLQ